jgi:hypothetical protein
MPNHVMGYGILLGSDMALIIPAAACPKNAGDDKPGYKIVYANEMR